MVLLDPRIVKQAKILVNYSTSVKKKDKVLIVSDLLARPLALAVYKECVLAGAYEIRVHFEVDDQIISRTYNEFAEIFLKNAKPDQIKAYPQISDDELRSIDCWIRIYAQKNTRGFSNIDPNVISERAKVVRPLVNYRVLNTRWVITNFPTEAQAQEADMSLTEYEDFVFSAIVNVDWKKKYKEQQMIAKLLGSAKEVRIIGKNTNIVLGKEGRSAENSYGKHNMPDGEVFTSVVEDKATGFVNFSYPAIYLGKEFHNVYLEFKDGRVIKAKADKGEEDLNKILGMDSGSRRIGELGIGNNFEIKRFTKDILFDEKIGGSIHLALGSGYKETGSKNESALHWDMIKDLKDGGELWFDEKLVQKNGKWLINL